MAADLLAWLEQADAVPAPTGRRSCRPGPDPRELDAVAFQGARVREWFRRFVLMHGGPVGPGRIQGCTELEPVNRLLKREQPTADMSHPRGATAMDGEGHAPFAGKAQALADA